MANNINFNVGFNTDISGLQEAQRELQKIKNMSLVDYTKMNPQLAENNINKVKSDFIEIKKSATELEGAFQRAFNQKLGTVNITQFNKELQKLNTPLEKIYSDMSKMGVQGKNAFRNIAVNALTAKTQIEETKTAIDRMGESLLKTGEWFISSSIVNRLAGSVQESIGYVKSLDRSLNDIRIVTGASANEMDKFAVKANKAAKSLGAATTDYTNAALIYRQQGLGEEETAARTETTLKMQNVTGLDATQASEYVTSIVNGYQVATEGTEAAIDKLAGVAAMSASSLEELATGMSKVASAASTMGVTEDQLVATMSTIISVTRQAPESVGTALKTIYARMGDLKLGETDEDGVQLGEVSGQLSKIGVEVLDVNGNMRDMGTIVEETANKWQGMSQAEKEAVAVALAGKRQYNNLFALFENWDMYQDALNASENSLGTLQKQQDIYMESTEAHLQQMSTSFEGIYDSILDEKSINFVAESLTKIANILEGFIDSLGGGIGLFGLLGSQLTKVFNGQITKEIVGLKNSLSGSTQQAEAMAQKMQLINTLKGKMSSGLNEEGSKIQDEGLNNIISIQEKMVNKYNIMTDAQKELTNAISEQLEIEYDRLAVIEDEKNKIEEEKKELEEQNKTTEKKLKLYGNSNEIKDGYSIDQAADKPASDLGKDVNKTKVNIEISKSDEYKEFLEAIEEAKTKQQEYKNITKDVNETEEEYIKRKAIALQAYQDALKEVAIANEEAFGEELTDSNVIRNANSRAVKKEDTFNERESNFDSFLAEAEGNILGGIGPQLNEIDNTVQDLTTHLKELMDNFHALEGTQGFEDKEQAVESLDSELDDLSDSVNKMKLSFEDVGLDTGELENLIGEIKLAKDELSKNDGDNAEETKDIIEHITKSLEDLKQELDITNEEINDFGNEQKGAGTKTEEFKGKLENLDKEIDGVNDSIEDLNRQSENIFDNVDFSELVSNIVDLTGNIDSLITGWSSLSSIYDTLTNPDLSGFEKFAQVTSSIAFGLSSTISGAVGLAENISYLGNVLGITSEIMGTYNGVMIASAAASQTSATIKAGSLATDIQEIAVKGGLITETEIEEGATVELTAAKIADAVASGSITTAEGAQLLATLGLTGGIKVLVKTIWELTTAMLSNPIFLGVTAIAAATALIVGLTVANEKYYESQIKANEVEIERLEQQKEEINNNIELTQSLEDLAKAYEKGAITLTEYKNKKQDLISTYGEEAEELEKVIDLYGIHSKEYEEYKKSQLEDAKETNNKINEKAGENIRLSLNKHTSGSGYYADVTDEGSVAKFSATRDSAGDKEFFNKFEDLSKDIEGLTYDKETGEFSIDLDAGNLQSVVGEIQDFISENQNLKTDNIKNLQNLVKDIVSSSGYSDITSNMELDIQEAANEANLALASGEEDALARYEKFLSLLQELKKKYGKDLDINAVLDDEAEKSDNKYAQEVVQSEIGREAFIKNRGGFVGKNSDGKTYEDKDGKRVNYLEDGSYARLGQIYDEMSDTFGAANADFIAESLPDGFWENFLHIEDLDEAMDYIKDKILNQGMASAADSSAKGLQNDIETGKYITPDNLEDNENYKHLSSTFDVLEQGMPDLSEDISILKGENEDITVGTEKWAEALDRVQNAASIYKMAGADGKISAEELAESGVQSAKDLRDGFSDAGVAVENYDEALFEVSKIEADSFGISTEDLQAEEKVLLEMNKELNKTPGLLKSLATQSLKLEKSLSNLKNNTDKWYKVLKSNKKTLKEQTEALDYLREQSKEIFNGEEMKDSFLLDTKNLEDFKKAAEGDVEAIDRLRKAAAMEIVADIDTSQYDQAENDVQALKNYILNTDLGTLEAGAELDDQNFLNALDRLIAETDMSQSEISSLLGRMGFDVDFTGYKDFTWYIPPTPPATTPTIQHMKIPTFKARSTGSGGRGGGRSGGGGGGGGSSKPSTSEGQNQEAFEDDIDIYHEINTQIDKTTAALERLQNQQEKLSGKNLLNNIKAQIRLNQQLVNQQTAKLKLQQKEAQVLKTQLLSLDSRLKLNKDGTIGNYDQLLSQRVNEINAKIEEYNALYGDGKELSEDQQKAAEAMQKEIERMKESYQDLKDMMDQYDEMISQTIADTKAAIADAANQEIQLKIDAFSKSIEIKLEINELKRELNEFVANVTKVSLKYGKDLIKDIKSEIAGARSYVIGNKSDYNVNVQGYKRAQADFNAIQKGKVGKVYGNNAAAALEAMQQYAQGALEALQNAYDAVQSLKEGYTDFIDTIGEAYDEQKEQYDYINSSIEHQINLIQKIKGENAYDDLDKAYNAQIKNSIGSVDMYKQQVAYYDKTVADYAKRFGTDSEQYKAAIKAQQEAKANLESSIDEALEYVQVRFENTIDKIANKWATALATMNPEVLSAQWENYKAEETRYLDPLSRTYQVGNFSDNVKKEIDKTDNVRFQQELNNLLNEEIARMEKIDKLSQNEVDYANLRLQLKLKELALEEAKENKTKMRLKRDSQGNYSYVYTADEDNIAKAQEEYKKAAKDLYDRLVKDKQTYEGEYVSATNNFAKEYAEIAKRTDLSEEDRAKLLEELKEKYAKIFEDIKRKEESLTPQLKDAAVDFAISMGEISEDFWNSLTDDEKAKYYDKWIGDKLGNTAAKSIKESIASGDFIGYLNSVIDDTDKAIDEKAKAINEIGDAAGIDNLADTDTAIKNLAQSTQTLTDNNKELATNLDKTKGSLDKLYKSMSDLIKFVDGKGFQDAIKKIQSFYSAVNSANYNDASALNTASYEQISRTVASYIHQTNGTLELNDMPTLKAKSKSYSDASLTNNPVTHNSQIYGKIVDIKGDAVKLENIGWVNKKDLVKGSFDTGGYTGEWDDRKGGRLAMLHSKELVLNKYDTSNFLKALQIMRDLYTEGRKIKLQEQIQTQIKGLTSISNNNEAQELNQNVKIEANFPNVRDASEIERALNNLVNTANQYIWKN